MNEHCGWNALPFVRSVKAFNKDSLGGLGGIVRKERSCAGGSRVGRRGLLLFVCISDSSSSLPPVIFARECKRQQNSHGDTHGTAARANFKRSPTISRLMVVDNDLKFQREAFATID